MEENIFENRAEIEKLNVAVSAIKEQLGKAIFGQERVIELMIVGLLCDGHLLMEGVPGIAKTLLSRLFAKSLNISFKRIQFTPDLMPSDVLGTSIFNPKTLEFEYRKGPVFGNFILIDEVNRSPAKTQASLFELMEERQVTMDGTTYPMARPFMVVATQNPVEQEGTYRLPEAQLDRFLLNIMMDYPSAADEETMLRHYGKTSTSKVLEEMQPVMNADQIVALREIVTQVIVEDPLITYITNIVQATRNHRNIELGASPRASIALLKASKAYAAMNERYFVIPDDIKTIGLDTLRHRIMLTPEAEIEGITADVLLKELFDTVEIPR
ncbi:MoxR-like ATPase [Spirosomataceae bacterium TFI 002]|nr:MoxR-like ATPase [Spirosomataceae bacterium TFI 002]